ncbi:STAS domain-containing protein [Modestobacter marinus]|uniref:STAS domain-containing protein n=1 Tax=Modestobacter marinus TaxID=477641 RepID=UPI001C96FC66|nr:STAS domain-containing protein [Modestobacter marinus]
MARALPPVPQREQLLSVTVLPGSSRDQVVVEVVGEVDAFTAPLLEACLQSQTDRRGLTELVVDLEQVTFLGAAGIASLASAHRRCRSRAARLVLHCGRRRVLRPLQLTGLSELVTLAQRLPTRSPREATRPRRRPRRTAPRRPRRGCQEADAPR